MVISISAIHEKMVASQAFTVNKDVYIFFR